ncbi:hypothetical protein MKW94_030660 [Papaver nudicaule]|uniref:HIT domain-containing protein n=1 Tax=Papaver nudicaule TaxID=74823 RepID=A0AA41SIH4_PAPNU|nr:hypothetical protein [Papaver nudicaule]
MPTTPNQLPHTLEYQHLFPCTLALRAANNGPSFRSTPGRTTGLAEPRHNEILGHLLYTAKVVAEKEGILDGFRVVVINGPGGCQSVYHLHLHVLGGRQMKWPPG